eukprot:175056_1
MTRIARTLILLILISGTPIIHCAEDTEYKDSSTYYPPVASKNDNQGYFPNAHTTYGQQSDNTDNEAVSTENPESELADPKPSKNANQGYLPNPHTTYRQQTNNTDDEAVSTEK